MKNRRSLLKIGVISAVSFIVTACTKAVSNSSAPNQDSAPADSVTESAPEVTQAETPAAAAGGEIVIAQVSALVAGEGFNFKANDGTDAILFKTSDDKVYALTRVCTHNGCSVDFDAGGNKLVCPCHGAQYQASDGSVISGPTEKALKKINIKVDGENVIEVI